MLWFMLRFHKKRQRQTFKVWNVAKCFHSPCFFDGLQLSGSSLLHLKFLRFDVVVAVNVNFAFYLFMLKCNNRKRPSNLTTLCRPSKNFMGATLLFPFEDKIDGRQICLCEANFLPSQNNNGNLNGSDLAVAVSTVNFAGRLTSFYGSVIAVNGCRRRQRKKICRRAVSLKKVLLV